MQFIKKIVVSVLTMESRLILRKYKPFIVAVVGSVGKTSTKDAIYCVLKDHESYVRKSEKSMNSDIGLPLSVIGAPNAWHDMAAWLKNIGRGLRLILSRNEYPSCLILEIGADHPGDIRKIAKWLRPDVVVVTKISRTPVHVEFFKSPEQVFEEKASIVDSIPPQGALVVFADDDKIMSLRGRAHGKNIQVISYGLNAGADVSCSLPVIYYEEKEGLKAPAGIKFDLIFGKDASKGIMVKSALGQSFVYPILAAAAVGKSRGIAIDPIAAALADFEAPKGRMNIIPGLNGSTIIDDTYNSSPDAVSSALKALKDIECGSGAVADDLLKYGNAAHKIAVLGDMMELGKYSAEEHRRIGKEAVSIVSKLVTVGMRSRATADEAVKNGFLAENVKSFETSDQAAAYLPAIICAGDVVLVKGSQSLRMERIVKALLREPDKADRLLVRQEKEWLKKA